MVCTFPPRIQDDPPEHHNELLATVDSLELVTSRGVSKEASAEAPAYSFSPRNSDFSFVPQNSEENFQIPSYMKQQQKPRCQLYAKMSRDEWEALKKFEHPQVEESSSERRRSSVTFGESQRSSRKSSILKRSSIEVKNEIDQEQNALHLIHEKCREQIGKLKMKDVFELLCDDGGIDLGCLKTRKSI